MYCFLKGGVDKLRLTKIHRVRPSSERGFTLTELLVVIVIIAILSFVGAANYMTSLKRGRDGQRVGDLNNLRNALEMYYLDHTPPVYPDATGNWEDVSNLEGDLVTGANRYTQAIPLDPKSGLSYMYRSSGSCYCLSAQMEVEDSRTSIGDYCTSCPGAHSNCYLLTCP